MISTFVTTWFVATEQKVETLRYVQLLENWVVVKNPKTFTLKLAYSFVTIAL